MELVSVFFPLRAGSSRAVGKNTRPFRLDGRSLFQHKMEQLEKISKNVAEIVISTNDEEVIAQFEGFKIIDNARLVRRPDVLCNSTTKVKDLIDYVPTVVRSDHIFWLHATSPFVDQSDYLSALDLYTKLVFSGPNDSLMSVSRLQQFIWSDSRKAIINCDRAVNPWPNTQDLEPLYEINHAFYISSRHNYLTLSDRIGTNPALYEMHGLKKIDIDWEEDFILAQNIIRSLEQVKNDEL
ncbi:N-acylneuraminate cytidylyltransferase [Pseudochelatococcus lubricantis]|uniref:N-acylneuraminate cytidylyltransferase n=1 Tax=Pseudochelatococcus lubricantis TaxID=1538102 RepID=A0ABX0V6U7_9HYPH|nr:acylneuraminate cytidylyltransferase family protein [Pseudochelatococcus lubricantis]NIJ60298.1 N-acylneuraminate cytidylyltransferase [Pseudochelatococcus lubricantis]